MNKKTLLAFALITAASLGTAFAQTNPGPAVYIAGFDGAASCYWKNGIRSAFSRNTSETESFSENTMTVVTSGGTPGGTPDVYVAGAYFVSGNPFNIACYWKNGVRIPLVNANSRVQTRINAMTVVNSGGTQGGTPDVYVAGFYDWRACYWKNGTLTILSNEESNALAITVVNSGGTPDVYVAGYYKGDDKMAYACYWKNGQRTIVSTIESEASSISVVNTGNTQDVYLAGYYSPAVIPYACYWKNGQRVNLSTVRSKAHNMTVVTQGGTQGGTPVIYVAGFYVDDGIDKPCYWRNGQRTSLYSSSWSETSEALAIMVVNSGGIYVAGYCSDETINQMKACYWINGERKLIPAGNGSFANAIFVVP